VSLIFQTKSFGSVRSEIGESV